MNKSIHLLYEIYIMKSTTLELSSTTRKSKIFTSNFDPILMSLNLSKLGMGNIVVPYLQQCTLSIYLRKERVNVEINWHFNSVIYLFPALWPFN